MEKRLLIYSGFVLRCPFFVIACKRKQSGRLCFVAASAHFKECKTLYEFLVAFGFLLRLLLWGFVCVCGFLVVFLSLLEFAGIFLLFLWVWGWFLVGVCLFVLGFGFFWVFFLGGG